MFLWYNIILNKSIFDFFRVFAYSKIKFFILYNILIYLLHSKKKTKILLGLKKFLLIIIIFIAVTFLPNIYCFSCLLYYSCFSIGFTGFCLYININLQSVRTHSRENARAYTKRVMPRNNPLCRLIDQITSRWNTLSNSDHHTHRPSGTRHFYSCSLTLIAPSISPHFVAPPSPTRGHRGSKVAKAPFFISLTSRNSSMWNH